MLKVDTAWNHNGKFTKNNHNKKNLRTISTKNVVHHQDTGYRIGNIRLLAYLLTTSRKCRQQTLREGAAEELELCYLEVKPVEECRNVIGMSL